MRSKIIFFTAITLSIFLVGCTGLTSVPLGNSGDKYTGTVYFMPTTRIPLTVSVDETNKVLRLTAGEPVYISDEKYRFRANTIYSLFHAETTEYGINAKGLLTKVDLESDGRLDEIVVEAVKSALVFAENSQLQSGAKTVYSTNIDVGTLAVGPGMPRNIKLTDLNQKINNTLGSYITNFKKRSSGQSSFLQAIDSIPFVSIEVFRKFGFPPTGVTVTQEDCDIGFCYRLPVGYTFTATFFDGSIQSADFEVPNGSQIFAMAVQRGLFTKWHTSSTLKNGMLETHKIQIDGSEIEELVKLPSEIVAGQIEALTQKGNLFTSKAGVLDSQVKLLEARQSHQKALSESLTGENASVRKPLFVFHAGSVTGGQPILGRPSQSQGNQGPSGDSLGGSTGTGK